MKRFISLIMGLVISMSMLAQDKYYLLFEFMKVDNEQQSAYMLAPDSGGDELSEEQRKKMQEGTKTRDMKFSYIAKLIKKVR
jgi:hypothetical protein